MSLARGTNHQDAVTGQWQTGANTTGLVDLRAFVGEPGAEHRETLASASAAAAAGGVTTLVCMPDTNPPIDDPATRAELLLLSPSFLVPCLEHGAVKVWDTLAIADHPQAHAIAMQLSQLAAQIMAQEPHEIVDLVGGAIAAVAIALLTGALIEWPTRGAGDPLVLGLFASIIVAWFSRQREFRADAGSAQLLGSKRPMINALARLGQMHESALPQSVAALGINKSAGVMELFASHPPIEQRIAALQRA